MPAHPLRGAQPLSSGKLSSRHTPRQKTVAGLGVEQSWEGLCSLKSGQVPAVLGRVEFTAPPLRCSAGAKTGATEAPPWDMPSGNSCLGFPEK